MRECVTFLVPTVLLLASGCCPVLPWGPGEQIESTGPGGDQWIAFVSFRDDNGEIYKMRDDGNRVTRLTRDPAYDHHPTWSPDGRWIAFKSNRDMSWDIYKMRADGSEVARLTERPYSARSFCWSPDGNWMTFDSKFDGNWEICKVKADGSEPTRLTNHPAFDSYPAWSPDGSSIAFVSNRDRTWDIYKMRADGSQVVRLTDSPYPGICPAPSSEAVPSWSPDGKWIAFESDRDGNGDIYTVRADGAQLTRLTEHRADDKLPSWSPDGNWIAFVSSRDGNYGVYKVRADGNTVVRLTEPLASDPEPEWTSTDDRAPSWSPDGDWIAFVAYCGSQTWEIYKVKADGSQLTRLTQNSPNWIDRILADSGALELVRWTDQAPSWGP